MKSIEWLREKLEEAFIPYPEEAFVEWWIENDKLPKRYKEHPYKVCSVCKEALHITKYGLRRGRSESRGEVNLSSHRITVRGVTSFRREAKSETFWACFPGNPSRFSGYPITN